jgi:sugar-specific transcriptional regulator TrmB
MKYEKLEKSLKELGLEENEAKLYLAMLGTGPTTVLELARASGMKRANIYNLIDRLAELGLARIEPRGFKRVFVAEDPENLKVLLQRKKKALEETLPFLQELAQNKGGTTFIKYYQGLNAIREVYEGLLKEVNPKDDYLVLSNQEAWEALDPDFFPSFQTRRAKLPVNIRLIFQKTPSSIHSQKFQKNINAKIRLLDDSTTLTTNLIVLPHKVVIHQLVAPHLAIVIENQNVVKMHKEMFEIIWSSLPE